MNHPHKSQAAAMNRAGELPDGEQLREFINSGQVSAAQVVAHAEAGDLPPLPSNVPHVTRRIRACESEVPAQLVLEHAMRAYATAALAAERAEVARLRAVILQGARIAEELKRECGTNPESPIAIQNGRYMGLSYFLRAALNLNPTQGATNHE